MELYALLTDIIKYTIAGIGVVWVAFYLVKPYLERAERVNLLELKKAASAQTLPLRLQAYERAVLFVDRINPANLLLRLNASGYSAAELHSLVISEIRNEFQHNVTQQLYLSTRAWSIVKKIKDDTLALINNAAKAMPPSGSGLDLSKSMLGHLSQLTDNPYEIALNMIRSDIEEIL